MPKHWVDLSSEMGQDAEGESPEKQEETTEAAEAESAEESSEADETSAEGEVTAEGSEDADDEDVEYEEVEVEVEEEVDEEEVEEESEDPKPAPRKRLKKTKLVVAALLSLVVLAGAGASFFLVTGSSYQEESDVADTEVEEGEEEKESEVMGSADEGSTYSEKKRESQAAKTDTEAVKKIEKKAKKKEPVRAVASLKQKEKEPSAPVAAEKPKERMVEKKVSKQKKAPVKMAAVKLKEKPKPKHLKPAYGEDEKLPANVVDLFKSIHKKASVISRADLDNQRLSSENANLKRWIEEIRFDCAKMDAKKETKNTGLKLSAETGARLGVVLSSIDYRPPSHLLPGQLYTLGVSYMKGGEYEKSAVIFSYLTGLDEDDRFKTIENYLITGVSWYRVKHYKLAESYFDRVMKYPKSDMNTEYLSQAILWKALVAQITERYKVAQKWLTKLVDRHPFSEEAHWVNPQGEVMRQPASQHGMGEGDQTSMKGQDDHGVH